MIRAAGDLARHESWYASLLHMCFRATGADVATPLGDEVP